MFVRFEPTQRLNPVSGLQEQLEEAVLRFVIQRVGVGPTRSDGHGTGQISGVTELLDVFSVGFSELSRELDADSVHPALELTGSRESPTGQKRPAVFLNGYRMIPPLHCLPKRVDIHGHGAGRSQPLALRFQPLLAQLFAKQVQGLTQRMAGSIRIVVGPKEGHDLFASDLLFHRKVDQEGRPDRLVQEARQLLAV
jgi:hypothetical protein